MSQDQHYLPQAYLRQWCAQNRLLLYRQLASPSKLLADRKAPKSVAFEVDLYSLPPGATANQRTGNDIELLLGKDVDQRIARIVARVAAHNGIVTDQILSQDIVWLLKTFVARSPRMLARMEVAARDRQTANRSLVDSMISRTQDAAMQEYLQGLKSPAMPRVAARAALVAAIENSNLLRASWLDGDVHVIHARDFKLELDAIGACEFVTFEDPVIEWGTNASGIVASFALSPELLVLVAQPKSTPAREDYANAITNHVLNPISHRENLICRSCATGTLLASASTLRPTVSRKKSRN